MRIENVFPKIVSMKKIEIGRNHSIDCSHLFCLKIYCCHMEKKNIAEKKHDIAMKRNSANEQLVVCFQVYSTIEATNNAHSFKTQIIFNIYLTSFFHYFFLLSSLKNNNKI